MKTFIMILIIYCLIGATIGGLAAYHNGTRADDFEGLFLYLPAVVAWPVVVLVVSVGIVAMTAERLWGLPDDEDGNRID